MRDDFDLTIGRRRPAHRDRVLGRDHRWWRIGAITLHEVVRSGPQRMAIHQRADRAAGENAVVCLVVLHGTPPKDDVIAAHVALDAKTLRVGRPAPEADALRRVAVLQRGVVHASERSEE